MRKEAKAVICIALIALAAGRVVADPTLYYVSLNKGERQPLQKIELRAAPTSPVEWGYDIHLFPATQFQSMAGIGGAFNEIGGEAIKSLGPAQRQQLLGDLFGATGAGFSLCRTPIGASDFAFDAYSYNDTPEDYGMKHFSVARDKSYLLPYIQAACGINPGMKLIASPWSPPGWMKKSNSMVGTDRRTARLQPLAKVYAAYALYLLKYVEAYADEGVPIHVLFIQNEVDVVAPYPSCLMPWGEMKTFVGDYLEPIFKRNRVSTQIGYGTFRGIQEVEIYDALRDASRRAGPNLFAVQYMSNRMLLEARMGDPQAEIMHTEGACFDGANSPEQASSRFGEAAQYINGGAVNFCYWNMVLNETRTSGWGWRQNSLVVVDRRSGEIDYTPEYNVLFLLSRFIRPGDVRIGSVSVNQPNVISVMNAAGTIKVVIQNDKTAAQTYLLHCDGREVLASLPPRSLCAIEWNPGK